MIALFAVAFSTPAHAGVVCSHLIEAQLDRSERKLERSAARLVRIEEAVAAQLVAAPNPERLERLLSRHADETQRRERLGAQMQAKADLARGWGLDVGPQAAVVARR